LLNLGKAFLEKKDLAGAMIYFRQAADIAPESWQSHNNMGVVCLRARKLEQASQHFKEALKLNPNEAGVQDNLKLALQGLQGQNREPGGSK
jgi:Flp pilus assembly protein TadD